MIDFIIILVLVLLVFFAIKKYRKTGCGSCQKDCSTCSSDFVDEYHKDHPKT